MLQIVGKQPIRVVSQADLENIMTYRAQIKRLQGNLEMIQHTAIESLSAGAEVEDGRRTVELRSKFEGGRKIVWMEVS